jgi:hypothetical protein
MLERQGGQGLSIFAITPIGAAAYHTQILSDSATVVLLGLVSISVAVALGLPPEPFVDREGACASRPRPVVSEFPRVNRINGDGCPVFFN